MGELEVHSPVLEHNLVGHAYLAEQDTNPFASPLVVYFLAEDPISGVRLKLAGETRIEPNGQLIGVFRNTPPLPAETIDLHLTPGERATFASPPYCRAYTSVARFTTWSGQHTERTSSFTPTEGPNGTPCQSSGKLPFSPSIQAGSVNNRAGAYSGFTLTIKRPDGQQSITGVSTTLPEGLAAKLASVTPCQEPANEQPWELRRSKQNRCRAHELRAGQRPGEPRRPGLPHDRLRRGTVRASGADERGGGPIPPRHDRRSLADQRQRRNGRRDRHD